MIEDLPQENDEASSFIERFQQVWKKLISLLNKWILINYFTIKIIKNLESLSMTKIEETSHSQLLKASTKIDPETLNFDLSEGNDMLSYCLWANLSHNPK